MKTIDKDELYRHLGDFLKSKGIKFEEGAYSHRVRQGCSLLTDLVNAAQKTVHQAKTEVDRKLNQLRQSIHNATAPKSPPTPPPQQPAGSAGRRPTPNRKAPPTRSSSAKAKSGPRPPKAQPARTRKGAR